MTTLHFNCPNSSGNVAAPTLVFSWNPQTGEVSGRDADLVRQMATWQTVEAHPSPWAWTLGSEPLRSYTDMAAIVGSRWLLPVELRPHYPQWPDDGLPELTYVDAQGVTILGRDTLTY